MLRACLEQGCRGYGDGTARCPAHTKIKERAKNAHRYEALRLGTGAQMRLRAMVNDMGSAVCASCSMSYQAKDIEIDHITPFIDGGQDVEWNVQTLCHGCHVAKTTGEGAARRGRPGY